MAKPPTKKSKGFEEESVRRPEGRNKKSSDPNRKETRGALYPGLTEKQGLFVKYYLIYLNSSKAARLAGYTAKKSSSLLLSDPRVAAVLRQEQLKRATKLDITADAVLQEIAAIGFARLSDVVDWGPGGITFKNSNDLPELVKKAVAEVSETISGKSSTVKVKMHDKVAALEKLMKHLGLYPKEGAEDKSKANDPLKLLFDAVLTSRQRAGHDVPMEEEEEKPKKKKSKPVEEDEEDEDEDTEDEDDDEDDSDDDEDDED